MPDRSNIVYRYDGTYQGFLCCVAECFKDKRLPAAIELFDEAQATLFGVREIEADMALAQRVEASIRKISREAHELVRDAFLSCEKEKEMKLIRFLLLGYKYGAKVTRLTTHEAVDPVIKMAQNVGKEAHYHVEFLRFSDYGEFLAGEITPKNTVLPIMVSHFCDRFSGENFMIYDKTHHMGFVHQRDGRNEFFHADRLELPSPEEREKGFRELWKLFYNTIAVEGRINLRQRMTMMPKRYWKNMTEFKD